MIPDDLKTQVLMHLSGPDFKPTPGSPAVWRYVEHLVAEEPIPEDLEVTVAEWVERQRGLQAEAAALADTLAKAWPVPTFDDVVSGKAVFPPFYGSEWWLILCAAPWARDLDSAVERAQAAVDAL